MSRAVLYVSPVVEPSGAERAQLGVLRADPGALVACPVPSPNAELMQEAGAATADLPFRSIRHSGGPSETVRSIGRLAASARDLRRIVRAHPERRIVYCFTLRPGLLAALATAGLGRTVVWNVTDMLPPGVVGAAIRVLARASGATFICHSETIRRGFASGRLGRALDARCHTITPGVDPSRFHGVDVAPGAPVAIVIGHVSPTKRTRMAVAIARQVAGRRDGFRLRVLGRAQYREEDFAYERALQAEVAAEPALAAAVEFKGYIPDVARELEGAGLLLHVRPDEPFGMVLTEAMAAGLPVIAPRAAGPTEIVAEGVTGHLFDPEDPAAAAALVERVLDDPERARRMGEAGAELARTTFSLERQVARIGAVLDDLAER